ncbi:hypothetical protein SAMN04515674_1252 [Pseudarcicella hirudinis]|uniref:SH3 domain-containing protein n=1 Tax=Pseudarcicella hirudinis TaxID=1079859 RepID=A0A1I5Z3E0_9BACT|nr:SH3 domain-containing protein [Pseudarcicella hirudinis]SFQ50989.1 hypothetical protein SAMN04515674_1252 [Pseudarcicella hirudinis]
MRNKGLIFLGLFFLCQITGIAQNNISCQRLLERTWMLDTENIYPPYKYENYMQYILFHKNSRFQYDFHPKDSKPFSGNAHIFKYYFVEDSVFNLLIANEYKDDSMIIDFFNDSKNKKYLHDDCILDFSKEIIIANVIHATIENESITDAHLYQYQFYDKDTFSQYGFGWTPGQPQIGYLYRLATNVPREVMIEIQNVNKIKFKTLTQKQGVIFSVPNKKTNMYLLKGDIVEVLEEKNQWLKIRYYGSKTIEGWIKKTDVE